MERNQENAVGYGICSLGWNFVYGVI